jgi:hypothetical protein
MTVVIAGTLWFLLAFWFLIILLIIGISTYSVFFSVPAWVRLLFNKIQAPLLKKLFAILALGIGVTAILLSLANHSK